MCKFKKLILLSLDAANYPNIPNEIVNCDNLKRITFYTGVRLMKPIFRFGRCSTFMLDNKMMIFCEGTEDDIINIDIPSQVTHLTVFTNTEFFNFDNLSNNIVYLKIIGMHNYHDILINDNFLNNLPSSLRLLEIEDGEYFEKLLLSLKLPFGCILIY